MVTVHAIEDVGNTRWLMIGPDQWINHAYVAMVTPRAAPEGIPAGVK
jgi:hypothetical protein